MRQRNPSMATWISLGLGGLVGYGVYRAFVAPSASTSSPTTFSNATPQDIAQVTDWSKATNTQVAAGDAQGNAFASQEKAIRDQLGVTLQGPTATRA